MRVRKVDIWCVVLLGELSLSAGCELGCLNRSILESQGYAHDEMGPLLLSFVLLLHCPQELQHLQNVKMW